MWAHLGKVCLMENIKLPGLYKQRKYKNRIRKRKQLTDDLNDDSNDTITKSTLDTNNDIPLDDTEPMPTTPPSNKFLIFF